MVDVNGASTIAKRQLTNGAQSTLVAQHLGYNGRFYVVLVSDVVSTPAALLAELCRVASLGLKFIATKRAPSQWSALGRESLYGSVIVLAAQLLTPNNDVTPTAFYATRLRFQCFQ